MYSSVLAIALLLRGPQQARHANAKPAATYSQADGHDGNRPPNESRSYSPVDEPAAANNTNSYQWKSADQPIPWWDHKWVGSLIAVLGLLINAAGLWLIYKQVKANVDSAQAAQKSADAALRQTDLLKLGNRPWLLVRASYNGMGYTFTAHNTGKSPAIITWRDPLIPARHVPVGEHLPPQPSYGYGFAEGGELVNAIWVEPGGSEIIGIFDSFAAFPISARLMVFSALKYRNTHDSVIHESRFCYRISDGTIALDGPPAYNRYT